MRKLWGKQENTLGRSLGEAAGHLSEGDPRALLSAVLSIATDAIITIDTTRQIRVFNRGAEAIFGYAAAEIVGQPIETLIPERLRGQHGHHVEEFARGTQTSRLMHQRRELVGLRKDGSEFSAEASIAKHTEDGNTVFTVILRDITDRKRTENQLRQAYKMEAIGQLTGGIAHDFNNLLTIVLGNLDMARDEIPRDSSTRTLLDRAFKAAEHGGELTHRLLAFSRKQALSPTVTDVNDLIGDLSELMKRSLGEDIEIQCDFAEDLWKAMVDRHELENAILNIAINARDAMPQGGKIFIETRNIQLGREYAKTHNEVRIGNYVLITISDTGCGIAPEILERVFDPFFTTKDVGKGSGLGLSMVYGFAQQTGGHAAIYSELGKGTTVKIFLPAADGEVQAERLHRHREESFPGGTETLLVVEDDPDVRNFNTAALRSVGYDVVEAGDGKAALALLDQRPDITLLVTDVVLPGGMNGREIAVVAKKKLPDIEVLFVSGYAESVIMHHGILDPGVALLMKPYTRKVLTTRVRDILDARNVAKS